MQPFILKHPCFGFPCRITWYRHPLFLISRFQHGDNPKHALEVSERELSQGPTVPVLTREGGVKENPAIIIDWLTRIHEYERSKEVI